MSSRGTKVTDPNATLQEATGPVASDSLAAESTRGGGGFAENDTEPLGVSGSNSTFANTNTSGAARLHPASDAEARMAEDDWAEEKKLGAAATSYPDAAGGQTNNYENGEATNYGGKAPSYVSGQYNDTAGPKGSNLTEGGFESRDAKNASFNSEIGSRNDPGRAAEAAFQRSNADTGGSAGMPKQQGDTGDQPYDALDRETSA